MTLWAPSESRSITQGDFAWNFGDAFVRRSGTILTLGHTRIESTLDLASGLPRMGALVGDGVAFAAPGKQSSDFSFMGINLPEGPQACAFRCESVSAEVWPASFAEAGHLAVSLSFVDERQGVWFRQILTLYPDFPAMASRVAIRSRVLPNLYWTPRGDLNVGAIPESFRESRVTGLALAPGFQPRRAVAFRGRTDYTNDIVFEAAVTEGDGLLRGNLLICDNERSALVCLQEAPPSEERRDLETHDFRIADGEIHSCCWGVSPHELAAEEERVSYRHVLLACADAAQQEPLLKQYLRLRFPPAVAAVTVNPWGCSNFRDRVSQGFLLAELKAAGELGATHYQVDDGWQAGGPLSDIVQRNHVAEPAFWEVCSKTLPDGFAALCHAAREAQVEIALWMAPSCNQAYRDWQAFAEVALHFYRAHGVRMFKFDAIKTQTKEAEANLEQLVRTLREASGGEIYINFDTTNGQRPGYFLMQEYGNTFLENRYVRGWGIAYHPESTLKNLWRLGRYVRPQTLQIEFADPGLVDPAYYAQRQLSLPTLYPPHYWAAVSLFASPLAWLAPSILSEEVKRAYAEVIALHRSLQADLHAGEVYPIGQEPSGASLSGFELITDSAVYVLAFREHGAPGEASWALQPGGGAPSASVERLWGQEGDRLLLTGGKTVGVRLAEPATFALWRWARDA